MNTHVLDNAIMDFIDDAVLQVITFGSDETYPSYKEFMKSKIALIKDDPSKLNDIRSLIPFLKFAPVEIENKCKNSLNDNNVNDFILFYNKIKEITDKTIDMGLDVFDDKEQMQHVHKFINDVLVSCMNSCKLPPKCTKNYFHMIVGKGNGGKSLYKELLKLQCKCPNCIGDVNDDLNDDDLPPLEDDLSDDGPPPLVAIDDDGPPPLVEIDHDTKTVISSIKPNNKKGIYELLQHMSELETTVTESENTTDDLIALVNSYTTSLKKMKQMKKEKLKQKDSKPDNNCDQINITI